MSEGPLCVAVINLEGGVGKTTIAALLGRYALGLLNLKVLAVDLDPQANLSQAYMRRRYRQFIRESRPSIVEVFSDMHPPGPGRTSPTRLKIEEAVVRISGHPHATGHLDLIPSRFDFSNHLTDSLKPDAGMLAKRIADHFQEKDLILIDCAPTESVFTTAAYHASRYVLLIPAEYSVVVGHSECLAETVEAACFPTQYCASINSTGPAGILRDDRIPLVAAIPGDIP